MPIQEVEGCRRPRAMNEGEVDQLGRTGARYCEDFCQELIRKVRTVGFLVHVLGEGWIVARRRFDKTEGGGAGPLAPP